MKAVKLFVPQAGAYLVVTQVTPCKESGTPQETMDPREFCTFVIMGILSAY